MHVTLFPIGLAIQGEHNNCLCHCSGIVPIYTNLLLKAALCITRRRQFQTHFRRRHGSFNHQCFNTFEAQQKGANAFCPTMDRREEGLFSLVFQSLVAVFKQRAWEMPTCLFRFPSD